MAIGHDHGYYLSHAFNKVSLQDGCNGLGEKWELKNNGDGSYLMKGLGGESHSILSN